MIRHALKATPATVTAPQGARPRIEIRGVVKEFPPTGKRRFVVAALGGIDLVAYEQEVVGLVGPSGCGKSTLLNLIAGFDRPTAGEIRVGGQAVQGTGPDRIMVFQSPALFPWLSVWDNVVVGPRSRGEAASEYEPLARELLEAVGLRGREHDYPYQLSGGMKQRVQLARALVNRPQVLLMDEPFGALDSQTRAQMQELLLDIWGRYHPTILLVTHDVEEAVFLCHRIYVLSRPPSRVRKEVRVPFPMPRELNVTITPEFAELKLELIGMLRSEATAS